MSTTKYTYNITTPLNAIHKTMYRYVKKMLLTKSLFWCPFIMFFKLSRHDNNTCINMAIP